MVSKVDLRALALRGVTRCDRANHLSVSILFVPSHDCVENKEQFVNSKSSKLAQKSVSIQSHSQVGETNQMNTSKNQSKMISTTPYNPYARAKRRKHCNVENSQTAMISPMPSTTTTTNPLLSQGINKEERDHNSRECHQSLSRRASSTKHSRNPNSARSKRARSSRRFGEFSFRTPSEFVKSPASDDNPYVSGTTETANLSSPSNNKKDGANKRQKDRSKMLLNLDDTDDDDESWLNVPKFSSLRR